MIAVILVISIVLYMISQMYFPAWILVSYIALSVPLAVYSFYKHEPSQGFLCILDILFFVFLYYRQNHLSDDE